MSKTEREEQINNLLDAYTQANKADQARLLEETNKEIEAFLYRENDSKDTTDKVFDFVRDLLNYVQEEFDGPLAGDSDLSGCCQGFCLTTKYKSQHS